MAKNDYLVSQKTNRHKGIAKQEVMMEKPSSQLTDAERIIRDSYVDAVLSGMNKKQAAIYAGIPKNQALWRGSMLYHEPYVQHRLHELREALQDDQIVTRKEIVLNLKSIAIDEGEAASNRIAASVAISKIAGYDAPTKTANLHLIQGGVMLVPVPGCAADWETAAKAAQEALKENVRK